MTTPMTEDEFADSRARHARLSAIVTLAVCSALSIAGCVYYAAAYGAGDVPTMLITATLSIILLLGIHLRASTHAAVEADRAAPSARAATTVGGVTLIGMALVGNYAVLHSLAMAKQLNPISAVLTPLALDAGVITATWTLFALRPKLVRSRRSAVQKTGPTVALGAPRRAASSASAPTAPTPQRAASTEVNTLSAPTTAVPKPEPGAHLAASVDAVAARIVTAGAVDAVAARIAASRATTQSAEVVAEIINARARGELKGPLARRLGLHHSAVQNVMDAACEPTTAPTHLVAIH